MTVPLVDLDEVELKASATRALHKKWARAAPDIRLFANDPEGTKGLILRGRIKDSISGKFPKIKNQAATYDLKLRHDHYLAKWLRSIPNDPEAKKNVVIVMQHMTMQWSGILHHWTSEHNEDGLLFMNVQFIDDMQYLDFTLGPPNPALPIPIFQFPRVLPIFGPTCWSVGFLMLINFMRIQGNWYTLPDDPFSWTSWTESMDMSTWQAFVVCKPLLEDGSLWTLLATRMDKISSVISDALEDSKCVVRFHRIMTIDGESPEDYGLPLSDCRNGALVFWVEDSGHYNDDGDVFGGTLLGGFTRSVVNFAEGFIEQFLGEPESMEIKPDEYYQPNFFGQVPGHTWVNIRDSKWSQVKTSTLTWAPATAVGAIVGGDNPYADQIAELIIQSVGNILGYFALVGFSSAGDIAATVIMPFLQGTILAWLQWENFSRAQQLGWVHLWEVYQQGAEQNAWSLSGIAALRAAFEATKSETSHQFTLYGYGPIYPGLHFRDGERINSTSERDAPNVIFTDQVEELSLGWDFSGKSEESFRYDCTVGTNTAGLSAAERAARLLNKSLDTLQNIGVRMVT